LCVSAHRDLPRAKDFVQRNPVAAEFTDGLYRVRMQRESRNKGVQLCSMTSERRHLPNAPIAMDFPHDWRSFGAMTPGRLCCKTVEIIFDSMSQRLVKYDKVAIPLPIRSL
jgi:hypothetical protein